jgi:hypothetical protein
MTTRQDVPAPGCKATKEGLLESKKNLDETDDCPVCEKRGILCEVANHPSRPLSTGMILKCFSCELLFFFSCPPIQKI